MKRRLVWAATALALLLSGVGKARAVPIYTVSTGNVSATVSFQPVAGGFEMSVMNTEPNTLSAAQAISQIQFTIGGNRLALPTAFTQIQGSTTTFDGNPPTPVTDVVPAGSNTVDHWAFSTPNSSTVNMFDVGGVGGQPNHLIVAPNSTPDASLTGTHLPSFTGLTNFFFADSSVPADLNTGDITGVSVAFGTGPETPLTPGTPSDGPPPFVTPEPASLTLLGVSALGVLGLAWRRRSQAARNSA
jgi:hypothetical protein